MAEAVYILCGVTSFACAVLLLRSYIKNRLRLLLWTCLCFVGLALNNVLLFFDLVVIPGSDISVIRGLCAVGGLTLMVYGLIWDAT